MVFDKEEIFNKSKEAIEEYNLFFVDDVVAFIPCGRTTFYKLFPENSDELNTLRELMDDNKIKEKAKIRIKLMESNKAAELLALYRLLATKEEHQKLNQSYVDHTTKGDKIDSQPTIVFRDFNEDGE